jgi:hypothetical protein
MGLSFRRILWRSWYYFRIGYGTYVALLVGIASNLVVLYRLGVVDIKFLSVAFPSLAIFSVEAIIVAVPVSIAIGLYHMKRTGAYAADASIGTEANPYMYKIIPGKEQEVLYPLLLLTAKSLAKVLDRDGMITPSEKQEFEDALAKANDLIQGQLVGYPIRTASSTVDPARTEN